MKKICVLTATRAEYGLLKNMIKQLAGKSEVLVVVTGSHLDKAYGNTWREVEADGVKIDRKIPILKYVDQDIDMTHTMSVAMQKFSVYFRERKPDLLIVLGDRYETLAVCIAAMNERIPIAHIHGGETTEGALDEAIRHAITKLSYLHFTSTREYRKRVIQLGEAPDRVFVSGAPGVENVLTEPLLEKEELENSIKFALGEEYGVVTFHPVTLENESGKKQIDELLLGLDAFWQEKPDMKYVITKANADTGGRFINIRLEQFAEKHREKVILVDSLGIKRYLSALKYCKMVIGNSSSGIVEAPSFQVPTVNIGDRQKGRIQAKSVWNCRPEKCDIFEAMKGAYDFAKKGSKIVNPYGDGAASKKIVDIILDFLEQNKIDIKKKFYDIDFEV